jgi:putative endonuclease
MKNKELLGKFGEDLACEYLRKTGYRVLVRNYRKPWGEIDIVAKASDRTLVFVEVKTMHETGSQGLKPEDQMSAAKLLKFKRTCTLFVGKNLILIDEKKGWRMDVVAIVLNENGRSIKHYENI